MISHGQTAVGATHRQVLVALVDRPAVTGEPRRIFVFAGVFRQLSEVVRFDLQP